LREDTCVIFSEELKFIEKLGYKYKINNFLQFSVGRKTFNNLIYHFYALKDTKKDNFIKLMSKNLLNSLYGRFSLKISKENSNYISAAISSYARIEIYQYKILQNYLYSDTDSVFTFLPLRKKYISRKIGMLKLEDKINNIQILKEKAYMYETKYKKVAKASGMLKYLIKDNRVKNKIILGFLKLKNLYLTAKEWGYTSRSKNIKKVYLKKKKASFFFDL